MKKWMSGVLSLTMLMSLTACSATPEEEALDQLEADVDEMVKDLESLLEDVEADPEPGSDDISDDESGL